MNAAAHVLHLARRFAGSLSPRPPAPADDAWAESHLGEGERVIWRRLSNPDRRHAIGVARTVADLLGADATPPVVAAALLHDSGKIVSGYGTFARVGATVWSGVRGRERASAGDSRLAQYLRHDVIGADALAAAGADPLTVAWAREHHLPPERWTVDARLAGALKAADDD